MDFRIEKDLLGEREIPKDAYWGIQTLRAVENFPFAGPRVCPELIKAYGQVKLACARTNHELGYLEDDIYPAIEETCLEIIAGKLSEQFVLPAIQGGAGTSINMNLNEVIANRSLELLHRNKGDYALIDPLNHINLHQSTNDTFPTALKISVIYQLKQLSTTIASLQGALQEKEKEFAAFLLMGKTELQDAVPITLGSQFASFAEAIGRDRWRTFKSEERIRTVNIGGTAVGTGLAAPREYIFTVIEKLRDITGLGLSRGDFMMAETANTDPFIEVSGMLAANAGNLIKISNDLRMLHYLGEIRLMPRQAGSTIMPGKVNPVIPEACISAAMKVLHHDGLVKNAASSGTFQINEFLPLIGSSLLESLSLLLTANEIMARHVKEISADLRHLKARLSEKESIITAFLPFIGYQKAEEIVKGFRESSPSGNFREYLINLLGNDLVEKALSPGYLMSMGYRKADVEKGNQPQ